MVSVIQRLGNQCDIHYLIVDKRRADADFVHKVNIYCKEMFSPKSTATLSANDVSFCSLEEMTCKQNEISSKVYAKLL